MTGPTAARRGRPPLSDSERAERHADLTDRAIRAVREGGADQSIEDLAGRLGVSKPVIYATFGGRSGVAEAMSVELASRMQSSVVAQLGPMLDDGTYDVTVDRVVDLIVEGLLALVEQEPEIYAFIVTTIRGERRGVLDNALAGVVSEHIHPIIEVATPSLSADGQAVLTDGIYGLALATLESWQTTRALPREAVVRMLTTIILAGLHAIESEASDSKAADLDALT